MEFAPCGGQGVFVGAFDAAGDRGEVVSDGEICLEDGMEGREWTYW